MTPSSAHRRAVKYAQSGNAAHLAACLAVRREMGGSRTLALAHDLARSVDTVERMGRAGQTYVALRHYAGHNCNWLATLRDARCQLYYTHFEVLGKWWFKMEFSPKRAFEYLGDAVADRYSTRQLEAAIAADYRNAAVEPFHLGDWLSGEMERARAALAEAQTDSEIEAVQRVIAFFDGELSRAMYEAERVSQ